MGIGLLLIFGGAYGLFEVSSLFALNKSQRKEDKKKIRGLALRSSYLFHKRRETKR